MLATFNAKIGSWGTGNDQFDEPDQVTGDGTYIWVIEANGHRINKRLMANLSFVAKLGSSTPGNDGFTKARGICNDGTNLYVADSDYVVGGGFGRITKRLMSDMSFVAGTTYLMNFPMEICTNGTHCWLMEWSGGPFVTKILCSDLSVVTRTGSSGTGNDQFTTPYGICHDGTHLYIGDTGNGRVVKRLMTDSSYVAQYGSAGSGQDQLSTATRTGMSYYNGNIYIADGGNDRIMVRRASDLSYVYHWGTTGLGDSQFNNPHGSYRSGAFIYITDQDFADDRLVKWSISGDLSTTSDTPPQFYGRGSA